MSVVGNIVQVIGPVIDIRFDPESLPSIKNAIEVKLDDENTMIVTGNTKTDAGTTTITIELADPDDYQWSTNDTRAVSIEWTIEKAVLDAPALKQKQFTFDGKRKEVELVDDDGYIMTGDQKAVNAGEYQVVVAVENSNYAIEGTNEPNVTLAWTINKAVLAIPTLETSQPFVYDGNEHTPVIADFDNATMIISGQTTGVNAGIYKFRVELKDKDNYVWSDGTIGAKTFGWTIDRSNNLLIIIISICLAVAVSSIVLTASSKETPSSLKSHRSSTSKPNPLLAASESIIAIF